MKYSIALIVAAVAATVSAQPPGLPQCSITCADGANSTCPPNGAPACFCTDTSFLASVSQCVQTACSPDDQRTAARVATDFCSAAGSPIPSPPMSSLISSTSASSSNASTSTTRSATPLAPTSATTKTATATSTGAAGKIGVSGLGLGAAVAALFLL